MTDKSANSGLGLVQDIFTECATGEECDCRKTFDIGSDKKENEFTTFPWLPHPQCVTNRELIQDCINIPHGRVESRIEKFGSKIISCVTGIVFYTHQFLLEKGSRSRVVISFKNWPTKEIIEHPREVHEK
ncbi:hypothetical protein CAPTEDRAFT_192510 [Capitella teleta]|uniref:Uncharacterized protein n=1 Tax=Capitella teleta TaxID=283909 RepID=R7UZB0_CAPTE|nr:hypothetical protein CAPTEDRAFT_192510 [Capitella teleta]|eukprot:ELU09292.1 hypothetical protein CAPTEDRAFT_192510 [Capitella teleta]